MKVILIAICLASPLAAQWNPKAAAAYLDERSNWWMGSRTAARDHDTFCISCHTALPYALARASLRTPLAETAPSPNERRLLDNVTKRVRMWNEVEPFYNDKKDGVPKTAEARGTEAILNALILATDAAQNGKMNADTRLAFANLWTTQVKSGGWTWLNFHNAPWEDYDSEFYGVALAALAVGTAPEGYRDAPDIQDNVRSMRTYLAEHRDEQSTINRVVLLWASTKLPGLLTPAGQKAIIREALAKQQEDGGWTLASVVGTPARTTRHDGTALEAKCDGYATGLFAFALQQAGVAHDEPHMANALTWLNQNQDHTGGQWPAYSLNRQRDPTSNAARFMSDAATAYAVLALTTK